MCKAKEYSSQLLEIYNKIKSDVHRLQEEIEIANKFNIDMLHVIENTNFNACDGYKLAKQIKENQTFRRQSKYELATLIILKKFIDKNINSLSNTNQEIINKDINYKYCIENKIYNPMVMGINAPEPVVNETKPSKPKSNFTSIPIPSIPRQPKEEIITLGTAIHKTTKAKLQVISKIDDNHYVVKKKGCGLQVMLTKNISDLELIQTAK